MPKNVLPICAHMIALAIAAAECNEASVASVRDICRHISRRTGGCWNLIEQSIIEVLADEAGCVGGRKYRTRSEKPDERALLQMIEATSLEFVSWKRTSSKQYYRRKSLDSSRQYRRNGDR